MTEATIIDEELAKRVGVVVASEQREIEVCIGVDLGKRHDPSAVCVTEVGERPSGKWRVTGVEGDVTHRQPELESLFTVRQLERRPLGESYPEQAKRIAEIAGTLAADRRFRVVVAVDQTGVGLPIVDLVRAELKDTRAHLCGVTLTASGRMTGSLLRREVSVGKEWLVSRLQALLGTGRIELPDNEETRGLGQELRDFEIRRTKAANLISGAFRSGSHDDRVIALALSVLHEPRAGRAYMGEPLWK